MQQAGDKNPVQSVKSAQLTFPFDKQHSVPLPRAFAQNTCSLLDEQAMQSVKAKPLQPASACFSAIRCSGKTAVKTVVI